MYPFCLVYHSSTGGKPQIAQFKQFPEILKGNSEGLYRSVYFFEKDNVEQAMSDAAKGVLPLNGPFIITHTIRRAGDMILENCIYEGMNVFLEVEGKRLPELPARNELEKLLTREATFVNIDGKQYRPNTEVFGFQQVYDDTVKTIELLKTFGVTQESMLILATPDEITIEIHPGLTGITGDPQLAGKYKNFLFRISGIRLGDRKPVKTKDRTIILDTVEFTSTTLVPGSIHPVLHRPKVCVGPSHFAYGPAAFSDYCGKKRTLDECLKEVKAWQKFIETQFNPLPKLKEALQEAAQVSTTVSPNRPAVLNQTIPASSGFQPLKREIVERLNNLPGPSAIAVFPFPELNKSLGGGLMPRGINIFVGPREEGKSAFLLNLAHAITEKCGIIWISREQTFEDFILRNLSWFHKLPMQEIVAKGGAPTSDGQNAKEKVKSAIKACAAGLPENFYFRGMESSVNSMQADEIVELIKLVQGDIPKVACLDGYTISELEKNSSFLSDLQVKSRTVGFSVLLSIHTSPMQIQRPHIIEGTDFDFLEKWHSIADSITVITTERANLKKFLIMTQGKVDPVVADKLEQKLYQTIGTKKMRSDTFSLMRIIHSRFGVRQLILYLYQREILRFAEGPVLGLGRP